MLMAAKQKKKLKYELNSTITLVRNVKWRQTGSTSDFSAYSRLPIKYNNNLCYLNALDTQMVMF